MSEMANALLLTAAAVIYFAVLAALFRARARLGIGAFFCALGVMHFLETYLAGNFYVALVPVSPRIWPCGWVFRGQACASWFRVACRPGH
jgi:hypothetical protein